MTVAPATFSDTKQGGASLTVQFNPATLKVSIQNKLQDEESGSGGARGGTGPARQSTRASTAKMEIELIFDSTETGQDVRGGPGGTEILRALGTAAEGDHPTPPVVDFRWGGFSFVGLIESLSETFDFWSAEGVPLRATVQVSMQRTRTDPIKTDLAATLTAPKAASVAPVVPYTSGATGVASMLGNSGAGRAIAALNGLASMRMEAGGSLMISAGVELKAAAGFDLGAGAGLGIGAGASLGFGIGASASAGIGASAGAGIGASASLGASAGVGASAGLSASASFGAGATAGVSATAGAFAGLGASKTGAVRGLDPARLLPPGQTAALGASFDITGMAVAGQSSGLNAQLSAGIR